MAAVVAAAILQKIRRVRVIVHALRQTSLVVYLTFQCAKLFKIALNYFIQLRAMEILFLFQRLAKRPSVAHITTLISIPLPA